MKRIVKSSIYLPRIHKFNSKSNFFNNSKIRLNTSFKCNRQLSYNISDHKKYFKIDQKWIFPALGMGIAFLYLQSSSAEEKEILSEEEEALVAKAGAYIEGLPEYTRAEVAKHSKLEDRIWVTYKNGVYDVTEFVEIHPGQDKILMAAGSSIDPFWAMYQQHNTPQVIEILEELRIGNLSKSEAQTAESYDPYATDPERHPSLVVRSSKPFNAEVPLSMLGENRITPNEIFYVRNHLPVPSIDPKTYVLEVQVEGKQPIKLTLEELKSKFQKHTVEATIQCAGNRRDEMTAYKEVRGGKWDIGAISNATWSGVRMSDVLKYAGLGEDIGNIQHVQFEGLDRDFEKSYGASIPIEKALSESGDVILAYEMNGVDIPKDHGFPIRVVAPGITGARNVKWLHRVFASAYESPNHWQQHDYKGVSPSVDWNNVDFSTAASIQELPVQSAIVQPLNGTKLPKGTEALTIKGYAWSGGGKGILRVDVSIDGGQTWLTANLHKPDQPYNRVWAWTLWDLKVPVPKEASDLNIVCKATDSSYNTQPEKVDAIWNLRGLLANHWHKVSVQIPASDDSKEELD